MFLIKNRSLTDAQYLLNLWLEVTGQNSTMSFWTVTFLTYESVCLEFYRTVTSETILKKRNHLVFINMNLVFLLAVSTNKFSGQLSTHVYVMLMTNLMKPCMEKLILNHLVKKNCPEFCNRFLDSYFFKLTLWSDCLEHCFWAVSFKTILTQ